MNDDSDPLAAELASLIAKDDQKKADDRESVVRETDLLALYYGELKAKGIAADEAKWLTRRYQSYLWGWTPDPDE